MVVDSAVGVSEAVVVVMEAAVTEVAETVAVDTEELLAVDMEEVEVLAVTEACQEDMVEDKATTDVTIFLLLYN